jgi:hypothetical protein
VKNIPPTTVATFANLLVKEVLATASDWTESQLSQVEPSSAKYAAERIKHNARKELIEYLTRSYGELN